MNINLSIGKKITIIGLIYTISIATLTHFMMTKYQESISFSEKEVSGTIFLKPLANISSSILSLSLNPEFSLEKEGYKEIEKNIHALKQLLSTHPNIIVDKEILTDNHDSSFISYLEDQIKTMITTQDQVYKKENAKNILNLISKAIRQIADTSNLILDPDLDTFHMMNTVINSIPKLNILLLDEKLKPELETKTVLTRELTNVFEEIQESVQKSVKYDAEYFGVDPYLNQVLSEYTKIRNSFSNSKSSDQVHLNTTLNQMKNFWDMSIESLSSMLSTRVSSLVYERNLALATTLFAWCLAAVIGIWIQRNLTKGFIALQNKLIETSNKIDSASNSILESASSSSKSSIQSTEAIQETLAAMTEIASMINQTKQNIDETSRISNDAAQMSIQGKDAMQSLSNAMADVANSNLNLKQMENILFEISEKTNIINEIVFKTQLLSVNASIEAARAGQHGKGFAVVASEVANLAAISGSASNEIKALLADSKASVSSILESTQLKIKTGKEVADNAINIFLTMADYMSRITQRIDQVLEASREQEIGAKQTATAMEELNRTAQNNLDETKAQKESCRQLKETTNQLGNIEIDMINLVSGKQSTPKNHKISKFYESSKAHGKVLGKNEDQTSRKSTKRSNSLRNPSSQYSGIKIKFNESTNSETRKRDLVAKIISKSTSFHQPEKSKYLQSPISKPKHQKTLNHQTDRFKWRKEYDIGVSEMNHEHKELLNLMASLEMANETSESYENQWSILSELVKYTKKHFKDEELFFDSINYPESAAHKGIHKNLLNKLSEFETSFSTSRELGNDFFEFLRTWLSAHIQGVDIKYAQHYHGNSEGSKKQFNSIAS